MAEYYVVVTPFSIGKEYIYKAPMKKEAEWLKTQLERLEHKAKVEKTEGGKF